MVPRLLQGADFSREDMDVLRSQVLALDDLFVSNSSTKPPAVEISSYISIVRGGSPVESWVEVADEVRKRISDVPSLQGRATVFLLPDYQVPITSGTGATAANVMREKYTQRPFEPVLIILSNPALSKSMVQPGALAYSISLVSTLASLAATFLASADYLSLQTLFKQGFNFSPETIPESFSLLLPISAGLLGLQVLRDVAKYAVSHLRDAKLRFPPSYLPSLQLGVFGSIMPFTNYPSNRKVLFDVSIAGPAVGLLASALCALAGLQLTSASTPDQLSHFPALPAIFLESSFLIQSLLLPLVDPSTGLIPLHPLLLVGVVGLIGNALNCLPIGRLDGGSIVTSIAGRRTAAGISFATLLGEALSFISNPNNPILFGWLLLVVLFQRSTGLVPLDDVSPIATDKDDQNKTWQYFLRIFSLVMVLGIASAVLLPAPPLPQSVVNEVGQGVSTALDKLFSGPPPRI
jgi:membrane-associated protease RseP (regulator of RpoE activity)